LPHLKIVFPPRAVWPLIGSLVVGLIVMYAPAILNDGDTYWHLAAGRWMLDHGQVLKTDIFSYTRFGAPWDAHEWLAEGLMALALRLGGWSGLLVLFAFATAATSWLMIAWLQRYLNGMALAATFILSACCMAPSLLARPHLLALACLAAWMVELLQAREAGRAPRLAFAILMMVWANLHGSYVFGFLLLAAFGLEALDAKGARWITIRDWGMFGALSLVAAVMTPQGVMGLIYPFKIMGMTTLNAIQEWRPTDFSKLEPFEITLLATLFFCLSRGVRVPTVRLAVLLLLLHMALQHVRHQLVLAVVAPLILAEPLSLALGPGSLPAWRWHHLRPYLPPAAAALAALAILVRLSLPITREDAIMSPVTALRHVPKALAAQPVLNDYGYGGYLIFEGVRPFIDGRADMYGDAFFAAYVKATRPDAAALKAMLVRYKIAWTLFSASDPTVKAMDAQPGWRRLYADKFAVVHVQTGAAKAKPDPDVATRSLMTPQGRSLRPAWT
jgi:hypothetical protein